MSFYPRTVNAHLHNSTSKRKRYEIIALTAATDLQTLIVWSSRSLHYDSQLGQFVNKFQKWVKSYEEEIIQIYIQAVKCKTLELRPDDVEYFYNEISLAATLWKWDNSKIIAHLLQGLNDYIEAHSIRFRRRLYTAIDTCLISLQTEMETFSSTTGVRLPSKARTGTNIRQISDWPMARQSVASHNRLTLMSQLPIVAQDHLLPTRYVASQGREYLQGAPTRQNVLSFAFDRILEFEDDILPILSGGSQTTLWTNNSGDFANALNVAFSKTPFLFAVSKSEIVYQDDVCSRDPHLKLLRQPANAIRHVSEKGFKTLTTTHWRDRALNYLTLFYCFVDMHVDQAKLVQQNQEQQHQQQQQQQQQQRDDQQAPSGPAAAGHQNQYTSANASAISEFLSSTNRSLDGLGNHLSDHEAWGVVADPENSKAFNIALRYPPISGTVCNGDLSPQSSHNWGWDSEMQIADAIIKLVGLIWRQPLKTLHDHFVAVVRDIWAPTVLSMGLDSHDIALLTYPLTPVLVLAVMIPVYDVLNKAGTFSDFADESSDQGSDSGNSNMQAPAEPTIIGTQPQFSNSVNDTTTPDAALVAVLGDSEFHLSEPATQGREHEQSSVCDQSVSEEQQSLSDSSNRSGQDLLNKAGTLSDITDESSDQSSDSGNSDIQAPGEPTIVRSENLLLLINEGIDEGSQDELLAVPDQRQEWFDFENDELSPAPDKESYTPLNSEEANTTAELPSTPPACTTGLFQDLPYNSAEDVRTRHPASDCGESRSNMCPTLAPTANASNNEDDNLLGYNLDTLVDLNESLLIWSGVAVFAFALAQMAKQKNVDAAKLPISQTGFREALNIIAHDRSRVSEYYNAQRTKLPLKWAHGYLRSVYNSNWWRRVGEITQSSDFSSRLNCAKLDTLADIITDMHTKQVAYVISRFPVAR